jgi:glycosyltransferase involved in cell wall biosynthesis
MRIHLIYPHGPSISCPDAIGRNVSKRLGQHHEVLAYDWDDRTTINPGDDDVLLGHPHPSPLTIFRRSVKRHGWRRILMMSPYNSDPRQVAFVDPLVPRCDLYLAITGNFWFRSVSRSLFAHWAPKMIHVDLAVDRDDFPVIKTRFNPPGARRFLYIGNSGWQKNTSYLTRLAELIAPAPISWIGRGRWGIAGLRALGYHDFATEASRHVVASHDFLLTVGTADSNPATILEAMAWGLVPVCTPTSGYIGHPGIVNIPSDDPSRAAGVLKHLQVTPEDELRKMQVENWETLDSHYNWDRFAQQLLQAIESDWTPEADRENLGRRIRLMLAALTSPYFINRANLRLLTRELLPIRRAH